MRAADVGMTLTRNVATKGKTHWAWVSRSISGTGLALALGALAGDYIRGAENVEIGIKQAGVCLVGLGLFLTGILLSLTIRAATRFTIRWVFALYLAACSLLFALLGPPAVATWVLFGYSGAICLLTPLRFGIMTFTGLLVLHSLATAISRVKVDLTGMPLTMLDINISVRDPAGLWDALSFPHWTRHIAVAVAVAILLWWLVVGVSAARRSVAGLLKSGARFHSLARLLALIAFSGLATVYLNNLFAGMAADHRTWHPAYVAKMADRVGILPFLAYSYQIERSATGDIYASDIGATPLSREEIRQAVFQYVDLPPGDERAPARQLPNIAVLLAESTFNPGEAFRLEGTWNDELFAPGEYTVASGPLRVNAIGGGTWITEFETIVGLDSRLFGYSGQYTHASIAPFVQRSIATHVRERGYGTWAFFANKGDFYNMRRAYERYGFQIVRDSRDLRLGDWVENDRQIVESVTAALGSDPQTPFLAYVVLLENHAPHPCDVADENAFDVRFAGMLDFEPNCALHEYLKRLRSTTAAVHAMRQYLVDLEMRSGRPFVLLVFGDHQPATFTSSGGLTFDYAPLRTELDGYTTFFHFQSSVPVRLKYSSVPSPSALLPTLLSAFVAQGPDDIYLAENLWLFSRCGSDPIHRQFGDRMIMQRMLENGDHTQDCRFAYERALASYRASGVIRLGIKTKTLN
jgi:hypothetical protein